MKTLQAKVLTVTAVEREPGQKSSSYTFEVLEFHNGLILVPGDMTNDWFFEDRDSIQPNGLATTEAVEETGEIREWTVDELLHSVRGSIGEFGEDTVPEKYRELCE